jgi:hypothetical protein
MSASPKSFVQLLLDVDQQKGEIQATLQQTAALLDQSRQLGEDARRIHIEVTEAIAQAERTLAQIREQR